MAVGFKVHFAWYEVGTEGFLNSFFSTISYHLEPEGWGTKYPYLMNHLYHGKIENALIPEMMKEILEIRERLQNYSLSQIIWDIEDLTKLPPYNVIKAEITNLSNYFVTSEGKDLFDMLLSLLGKANKLKLDFEIKSL